MRMREKESGIPNAVPSRKTSAFLSWRYCSAPCLVCAYTDNGLISDVSATGLSLAPYTEQVEVKIMLPAYVLDSHSSGSWLTCRVSSGFIAQAPSPTSAASHTIWL